MTRDRQVAHIVGSGPNGLMAAITMAQSGRTVSVHEANETPGGAVRTMEATLPGFRHDFGAAVHPMALSSPAFLSLPLHRYGLQWIHGAVPLAHPFEDGTAILLFQDMATEVRDLEEDGLAWQSLFGPLVDNWSEFAEDALGPALRIPRHPWRMAHFGTRAFQSAASLAQHRFSNSRTRALFAGLAAHSCLPLDQPLSAAVGLVLGAAAHAVGWPIPQSGSQAITDALIAHLQVLGGRVYTGNRITAVDALEFPGAAVLCDIGPRQLLSIAGAHLRSSYQNSLRRFHYGPGAFKIDYALSQPIPWRAQDCLQAITVHVGGSIEQIAESEFAATHGIIAEKPFLIVVQPSLFDPTRAPEGKHTAWVYCHVPNGSDVEMTSRIEDQLERVAPGFRDCVLSRHISSPAILESMNANLAGGDINGGELSLRQFFFRPALGNYFTGTPNLYLCSASTPPGGGVHGMCGYHAAQMALRHAGS